MHLKTAIAALILLACVAGFSTPASVTGGTLLVVDVAPDPGSAPAPVDSTIVVQFDRPIDRTSILPLTTFWAFGRWSGTVSGTFGFSDGDNTVTLTPDHPFSAGETVMVFLSRDIRGTDATTLRSAGYSFVFTTEAQPAPLSFVEIERYSTRTEPSQRSRAYGGIATDLNGDRFPDITIVNEITADLRVFMSRADGTGRYEDFAQPTYPVGPGASPSEPSDFDRDGDVDICVANPNADSVAILLGNGDGTFAGPQVVSVGVQPRGIAVLDVDGDGDVDIVNSNRFGDNLSLLLNDGTGVFGSPTFFEGGGSEEVALAAGDMNEDGILDLVVGAENSEQVIVNTGNGDGTFTAQTPHSCGGKVWMLVLGDLNGDSHLDVAAANGVTSNGAIMLGDGTGQLAAPQIYATDLHTLASDVGDMDGDGDLDWITASFNGDWRLFTNDGAGTFSVDQEFPSTQAASCSLMVDLDYDGDLDLVLVDESEDEVIFLSNGTPCAAGNAVTSYRDADQDGFGNSSESVASCVLPVGYIADDSDCDDAESAAWSTPGEARDLVFSGSLLVWQWDPPADPGGSTLEYDVIRSSDPTDFFTTATCIETDDGSDTMAEDAQDPAPNSVFHYLVRAENLCPSGQGSLGIGSGSERTGRNCP